MAKAMADSFSPLFRLKNERKWDPMKLDLEALKSACTDTLVREDHTALLKNISSLFEGKEVSLVERQPQWYRVGGLVDVRGKRIAEQLRGWLDDQKVDDVLSLYELYGTDPLYVTRIVGKTVYLVMPTGRDPLSYIQLEIDEVQEVVDRALFDGENLADDFEDLIDPVEYHKLEPRHVGHPRYILRNARNMLEVKLSLEEETPFSRFYDEWKASSASDAGHFSDFWILNFFKHKGAFGETRTEIKPVSRLMNHVPKVDMSTQERGQPLARVIHGFDRALGFPMAWYFSMLTSQKKFHKLAELVHEDLMGAYAYLPAKDLKILKRWIADPYCFY